MDGQFKRGWGDRFTSKGLMEETLGEREFAEIDQAQYYQSYYSLQYKMMRGVVLSLISNMGEDVVSLVSPQILAKTRFCLYPTSTRPSHQTRGGKVPTITFYCRRQLGY